MKGDKTFKVPSLQLIPVVGLIVGVVFLSVGLKNYGFWNSTTNTPTAGFFPVIVAVLLCIFSVLAFLQSLKAKSVEYHLRNWYVPFGFALFIVALMIIGTVPAVILFEILWVKWYEKMSWKTTIICVIFCLIIVIPVFTMWLGVSFPAGMIVELIRGY